MSFRIISSKDDRYYFLFVIHHTRTPSTDQIVPLQNGMVCAAKVNIVQVNFDDLVGDQILVSSVLINLYDIYSDIIYIWFPRIVLYKESNSTFITMPSRASELYNIPKTSEYTISIITEGFKRKIIEQRVK